MKRVARLLALTLSLPLFFGCSGQTHDSATEAPGFVTWSSQEPDTLASIWLVETLIAPGSKVTVLPPGAPTGDAITIAVPQGTYAREERRSAFAALLDGYGLHDSTLRRLNAIIETIEISPWRRAGDREAMVVETNLREAQRRFGDDTACMVTFFDYAYEALAAAAVTDLTRTLWQEGASYADCNAGEPAAAGTGKVAVTSIAKLVEWISAGRSVTFVDTREAPEYRRGHIPGAKNITLRAMDRQALAQLRTADIVVPYCVKDFRGYEVARFLAAQGIDNVHVMQPHGIAGWKALGLPIAQGDYRADTEAAALAQLRRCATMPNRCIAALE
ncbi:chromate resistance protein ChrB domain-containing protein [Exilibacterium tricleocarpae]|uniref:chromate resistance protein ChrB domain-containing protein n=1 Tax=Exilibacterium tricleocarpae TaxID=2591008 RepID=UPI0015D447C3|nr:chromate resistance protein ChrB domain-containing protein [Exilibacterium tricleocarpae]